MAFKDAVKKVKNKNTDTKSHTFANLSALVSSGVLDMEFFAKDEITNKVEVDMKTLSEAFKIIDKSNLKPGMKPENFKINFSDLKRRIMIINPQFPVSELSIFTAGKNEIYMKELYELLSENEFQEHDPLEEAINLLVDDKQNIDFKKIKTLSKQLGYPELQEKDIEILKECLDINGDGDISKPDFLEIFNYIKRMKDTEREEQREEEKATKRSKNSK